MPNPHVGTHIIRKEKLLFLSKDYKGTCTKKMYTGQEPNNHDMSCL